MVKKASKKAAKKTVKPAAPKKVQFNAEITEVIKNLDFLTNWFAKAGISFGNIKSKVTKKSRKASELAHIYGTLYSMVDMAEEVTKIFKGVKAEFKEAIIPDAFEREKVTTLTLTDGSRVTISSKLMASIKKENQSKAFQWLRDNGLPDLIQETVNAGTLSATATVMAAENKELPDDIFSTYYQNNTSFTKAKKK